MLHPIQAITEPRLGDLSLPVDAILETAAVAIPEAVHPFVEAIPPASRSAPPGFLGPASPPIHAIFSSAPETAISAVSLYPVKSKDNHPSGLKTPNPSAGQFTYPG